MSTASPSPSPSATASTATSAAALVRLWPWLAVGMVLIALPEAISGGYVLSLLMQMGIGVIFALSYNMLLGQTGMLSFGHAVYFGMGGFFTLHALNAIWDHSLPIPSPLLPLAGAAGGLLFGIAFGLLATRRAGTIFAMITLGLGELVAASAHIFHGFFGGEEGISGDRMVDTQILGLSMGPQVDVYYVIVFWMLLCVAAMWTITQTPLGRLANAVRDNPERVEFVGYSTRWVRFQMFALAGMFAGVAGGLHALTFEILTFETLGAETSAHPLLMAYIGGIGHFAGPIFGAVVVTLLEVALAGITEAWMFYLGTIFVFVVLFVPQGISGIVLSHVPVLRRRLLGRLLPAYAVAAGPVLALVLAAIILIEVNYHYSLYGVIDPKTTVFGIDVDTTSVWPWVIGLTLFAVGALGLRATLPRVKAAWANVHGELKRLGGTNA